MSHGQHNSAHSYRGPADRTRGTRLDSKLGKGRVSVKRLEALLKPKPPKEETDGGPDRNP